MAQVIDSNEMSEQSVDVFNQHITFEIPSNLDLEKIWNLDNYTSLLDRTDYHDMDMNFNNGGNNIIGNNVHTNLNDNLDGSDGHYSDMQSIFEKWSSATDYHVILNYLWIGVVTALVIMSIIFIIFSCYFYRKFKEWKKCNKDIRSQIPNDLYPNISPEHGYYQMESPPCYTIATGLPTYDEALLHAHFTFGMKTVLYHQQQQDFEQEQNEQEQQQQDIQNQLVTEWDSGYISGNNYDWKGGCITNMDKEIENIPRTDSLISIPVMIASTTTTTTVDDDECRKDGNAVVSNDCSEIVVIS